MDEFISNFQEFRDWLYEHQPDEGVSVKDVIEKFEELNLDKAF